MAAEFQLLQSFSAFQKVSVLNKVQQYSSYSRQSPFQQAPDIKVKWKSKARCKSSSEKLG